MISLRSVMPAHAGIHAFLAHNESWMAGTGPAMTTEKGA
jgi:hypothetical protein